MNSISGGKVTKLDKRMESGFLNKIQIPVFWFLDFSRIEIGRYQNNIWILKLFSRKNSSVMKRMGGLANLGTVKLLDSDQFDSRYITLRKIKFVKNVEKLREYHLTEKPVWSVKFMDFRRRYPPPPQITKSFRAPIPVSSSQVQGFIGTLHISKREVWRGRRTGREKTWDRRRSPERNEIHPCKTETESCKKILAKGNEYHSRESGAIPTQDWDIEMKKRGKKWLDNSERYCRSKNTGGAIRQSYCR
jgi:hypothetical protein